MDSSYGGIGSGEEETCNSQKGKKQYHRHTTQQIQQLDAFYKECPHPDKNQRQQLSRELGLDQKQIKFWFQNKRTQIKAQNEKADNNVLRTENEKIHFENLAMQEALKNIVCPACNGPCRGDEEKNLNLQRLRMENARLREEEVKNLVDADVAKSDWSTRCFTSYRRSLDQNVERLKYQRAMSFFSNYMGNSATSSPGIGPLAVMAGKHFLSDGMGAIPPLELEHMPRKPENLVTPHDSTRIPDLDKAAMIETAVGAMNELVELLRVNEPLWIKASGDGRHVLHHDSYDKLFPRSSHIKNASARFESSKDSGEVAMDAINLVETLLDANKYKDMFPTIVTKARTIEVLDTGMFGGLLHLMYEKRHILSPLVAPREFFFMRYCRQLNQSTWVMVDVSYDFIKELPDAAPTRSWKLPSGCMIEEISNGKSIVTWIEHVQVDDKALTHRLYRDLVCSCRAYGAKSLLTTLQRMCERFAFSMGRSTRPKHALEGVIDSLEGQRSLMNLCHRMIKNFCEVLSMSEKLDFPQSSEQSSGVQVLLRSSNGPGEPNGSVVIASTSLLLPLSKEDLFDFFKDEEKRSEWDVLSSGNSVSSVARVSTGMDPGNCISIIQPFVPEENKMMLLQESSTDALSGTIIYTPIDLPSMISAVNGEDTTRIPILPSGFVISNDGRVNKGASSSTSSGSSLLTVAFQILVCHSSSLTKQLQMESVATVNTLISSTIQKIKTALDCDD